MKILQITAHPKQQKIEQQQLNAYSKEEEQPLEQITNSFEMLEHLMCPAFIVKDHTIIRTNTAAQQMQIFTDTSIDNLLGAGKEDYEAFHQGRLCLTLSIEGCPHPATVTALEDGHLFCLESELEKPELQAYALAAQILREPLSNALLGIDQLLAAKDSVAAEQAARINRNLHQILRAVSNMSDAAQYADAEDSQMQSQDIMWVLDEVFQRATPLISQAGHTLEYAIPNCSVACNINREKLERAVLNMISNAAKYAPQNTAIQIAVRLSDTRISLAVENELSPDSTPVGNLFSRYLRQPGIEDARTGIGLGLSIVKSVAAIHGGTVLLEQPENKLRITMSIPLENTSGTALRSPVSLPVHYSGGYISELIELSDCLPFHLYDGKK